MPKITGHFFTAINYILKLVKRDRNITYLIFRTEAATWTGFTSQHIDGIEFGRTINRFNRGEALYIYSYAVTNSAVGIKTSDSSGVNC